MRIPTPCPSPPTTNTISDSLSTPLHEPEQEVIRTLFLTDSILSGTPPHLLSVPQYACVKKVNYKLSDIFNFEPEFKFSDQVVISAGVNDLYKYNYTAESLADVVCRRLVQCCRAHPHVQFVYNSILLSNFAWLNSETERFNDYMYEICLSTPNLSYFDSHAVVKQSKLDAVILPKSKGAVNRYANGIHITLPARKVIVRELARRLRSLAIPKTTGRNRPRNLMSGNTNHSNYPG